MTVSLRFQWVLSSTYENIFCMALKIIEIEIIIDWVEGIWNVCHFSENQTKTKELISFAFPSLVC